MLQVRTLQERSRYFVHREAKRKCIESKSSSQCHDRVANTTQAAQGDVRRDCPGLHADARAHDAAEGSMPVKLFRIARQALAEIDHQADDGSRLMGLPDDAEAEHF